MASSRRESGTTWRELSTETHSYFAADSTLSVVTLSCSETCEVGLHASTLLQGRRTDACSRVGGRVLPTQRRDRPSIGGRAMPLSLSPWNKYFRPCPLMVICGWDPSPVGHPLLTLRRTNGESDIAQCGKHGSPDGLIVPCRVGIFDHRGPEDMEGD